MTSTARVALNDVAAYDVGYEDEYHTFMVWLKDPEEGLIEVNEVILSSTAHERNADIADLVERLKPLTTYDTLYEALEDWADEREAGDGGQ